MLGSEVLQDWCCARRSPQKSLGLRPAMILLSIAVWGYLLGAIGIFFALPLTMVIYYFYKKYVAGEPIPLYRINDPKPLSKSEEKKRGGESCRRSALSASSGAARAGGSTVVTTQEDLGGRRRDKTEQE